MSPGKWANNARKWLVHRIADMERSWFEEDIDTVKLSGIGGAKLTLKLMRNSRGYFLKLISGSGDSAIVMRFDRQGADELNRFLERHRDKLPK